MGVKKSPPKFSTRAHDAFTGRTRRDIDSHHFIGPIKSRVTFFNGSMTWMQGKALVHNGSQDLFCEFEGDPCLIERRFGGSVERSDEKQDPVSSKAEPNPTATSTTETKMLQGLNEGPARNTRFRASGSLRGRGGHRTTRKSVTGGSWRRISTEKITADGEGKEKVKPEDTADNLAQITAGIVSFSVYSNHQNEDPQAANLGPPITGIDASDWAHPANHSSKVGGWLENKVQAGSQVPADMPPSQAPSSFAGVLID